MARRNQNTFLKRQKEMERVRKAKEKMNRRHGKKSIEDEPVWGSLSAGPSQDSDGDTAPEESSEESNGDTAPEESSEESNGESNGEGADDTSPDN